jgi:anhydro-N-acetylmuramic acid kinase
LPNGTLQIGDGDHLAMLTHIITLSDFRQKHIAAGGEGAPLAVYADYLLFSKPGEDRILLNIGGISNFTFLPGSLNAAEMFSSDVGPGNTLMDQWVQKYFAPKHYDEDAQIASLGKCNDRLLKALLQHDFFNLGLLKTTGPELFSLDYLAQAMKKSGTEDCSKEDVLATLCHFTAKSIAKSVLQISSEKQQFAIYQSGGGLHNPLLQKLLKESLSGCSFYTTEQLGVNPDAKEAMLFALLANETLAGQMPDYANRIGMPSVSMGKISLPY